MFRKRRKLLLDLRNLGEPTEGSAGQGLWLSIGARRPIRGWKADRSEVEAASPMTGLSGLPPHLVAMLVLARSPTPPRGRQEQDLLMESSRGNSAARILGVKMRLLLKATLVFILLGVAAAYVPYATSPDSTGGSGSYTGSTNKCTPGYLLSVRPTSAVGTGTSDTAEGAASNMTDCLEVGSGYCYSESTCIP
jgi:hypothetical protein